MSLQPQDLYGAWALETWYVESRDRDRTMPFGIDAEGVIMYTADGYMSAITRRRARTLLPGTNAAAQAAAFDSYVNYAGRWTLTGNIVTHHIEHALDPNWVGTSRERTIEHQGDRMVFSGLSGDGVSNAVIVWRRAR